MALALLVTGNFIFALINSQNGHASKIVDEAVKRGRKTCDVVTGLASQFGLTQRPEQRYRCRVHRG